MSATIEMKLKPWLSPNYAPLEMPPGKREDGVKELPSFHVSELPQEALDAQARQWLIDLYAKAKKPNPWAVEGRS